MGLPAPAARAADAEDQAMTPGKLRRLMTLADEGGRFEMLAIDQRASLQALMARAMGGDPASIAATELTAVKQAITAALAPYASAVLTDPIYGWPATLGAIPGGVGLLLTLEDAAYDRAGAGGRERRSRTIEGWSVAKTAQAGASAVKLLLPYRPDASPETTNHQKALAVLVGAECAHHEMPFLLELLVYPLEGEEADTPEYARRKPDLVVESAREFSHPEYAVDLLKLEFPAELKYCREYSRGAFDGREREPVHTLEQVRGVCRELDAACGVPWVLLSAGVSLSEFLADLELAVEAGSSGFLCGRALWQGSVSRYPDAEAMEAYLDETGAVNFLRANAICEAATPWFAHRPHVDRDPFASLS
jgi:tagatose 1,6-diphosphate aldolase